MQVLNFLLINLKKKAFLQEVKFQVGGVYKWAYEVQKKGGGERMWPQFPHL